MENETNGKVGMLQFQWKPGWMERAEHERGHVSLNRELGLLKPY